MALDLGDAQIVIKVDDKGANKKFDAIESRMGKMSKTFKKAGLAMMGAGALLGGGLIALGKGAADFETAMREVNTMVGLSEEGFRALSEEVKAVSLEVGKSSTELSAALYQIVSAGVPAAQAIDVLGVASKAAVAGVTSVEIAADGLTTILNAFKIEAKDAGKVADIMFTVVKRGKTNFEQLSAAIFQVAPIAASAGIKFEEVAAAIATITKQGVPTRVATTQLRQVIQAIIKPTDDMKRAFVEVGYASGETMLAELGLAKTITLVRDSAGGSLEQLGKMFGSVEALGAVLSLTGENAKTFEEDLKATSEGAAGAVEEAYTEMNKGVGRQFEMLFNDLKEMGNEIGETLLPVFKEIIEKIKPIVTQFRDWVEINKDLFPSLFKLAGVLIGAGGVLFAISQIVKVVHAINIALAIFHALSGPAGWIKLAAGMAIAGAAIFGISKLMPELKFGGGGIPGAQTGWGEGEGPTTGPLPPSRPPSLARGGIVPGPLGQPIPIIAHGGEAFGGVGGRMGTIINVNVEGSVVSERELVDVLRREFIRIKDRNVTTGF